MIHPTHRSHILRPLLAWMAAFILGMTLTGCSHWRESYLNGALKEVTQEDVVKKFGEPWKKKTSLLYSQSTWIYRYALTKDELDPMGVGTLEGVLQATNSIAALIGGGNNATAKNKPECFHYILTFNQAKVLQSWVREACADTTL